MKYVLITFLMLLHINCFGQGVTHIKGKKWEGYIFPKEYCIFGFEPEPTRYTLGHEDIIGAENILKSNNIYVYDNQYKRKRAKLKNYYRQYIGYKSADGHICVNIHLVHKSLCSSKELLSKDLVAVYDGGYLYIVIKVDLTDNTIKEIEQNGYS